MTANGKIEEEQSAGILQTPRASNLSALLAVIALGILVESIDGNIVTIALPKMALDLSSGISLLSWVATAYLVVSASTVVQIGKMADLFSKKRIFLVGLGVFGLSSALVGLSLNAYEVISFRVLQGLSGTFLLASGYPMIFEYFPPKKAAAAIGIASAAWSAGAVTGPVLGGFLVAIDWRLIFFINVPISIAGVLIGLKIIPGAVHNEKKVTGRMFVLKQLNLLSSALLAFTITTTLVWLSFFNYLFVILAVIGGAAFALAEYKSSHPLINSELLHNKGFISLLVGGGVITPIAIGSILYGMSYYFQTVSSVRPEIAGLALASIPIGTATTSVVAGRIYGRMKAPAWMAFYGSLTVGITLLPLYFLIAGSIPSIWEVSILLGIAGLGAGFWWVSTLTGALKFARPELNGVANGTTNLCLSVGFAVGIALTTIVSATYLDSGLVSKIFLGNLGNLSSSEAALFGDGIGLAMLVGAIAVFFSLPFYLLAAKEQRKSG